MGQGPGRSLSSPRGKAPQGLKSSTPTPSQGTRGSSPMELSAGGRAVSRPGCSPHTPAADKVTGRRTERASALAYRSLRPRKKAKGCLGSFPQCQGDSQALLPPPATTASSFQASARPGLGNPRTETKMHGGHFCLTLSHTPAVISAQGNRHRTNCQLMKFPAAAQKSHKPMLGSSALNFGHLDAHNSGYTENHTAQPL